MASAKQPIRKRMLDQKRRHRLGDELWHEEKEGERRRGRTKKRKVGIRKQLQLVREAQDLAHGI